MQAEVDDEGSSCSILTTLFLCTVRYLLTDQSRLRSVNDIMPMIGARFYTQLDASQMRNDVIEEDLAKVRDWASSRCVCVYLEQGQDARAGCSQVGLSRKKEVGATGCFIEVGFPMPERRCEKQPTLVGVSFVQAPTSPFQHSSVCTQKSKAGDFLSRSSSAAFIGTVSMLRDERKC